MTSDIDAEPVKPAVQLALKDTTVKEGKPARLDCVIVGQPEPEVSSLQHSRLVKKKNGYDTLLSLQNFSLCSTVLQRTHILIFNFIS